MKKSLSNLIRLYKVSMKKLRKTQSKITVQRNLDTLKKRNKKWEIRKNKESDKVI